jgi:outer membrane protein OmpA-like peptidoglycan-associated protein
MNGRIWAMASAAAMASGALLLSGCATEDYVDEQIAMVNQHITDLDGRLSGQLQQTNARLDGVDRTSQDALQRADAAGKLAAGKLVYTVLSEEDAVQFDTNKWKLSAEAQATLTAFAEKLKSENKNVYIEIIGHGDPRGSVYNNRILGEKRALEVRRFLTAQGIPLTHMETVSWGEEKPTQEGATADANAANRRVTLRVLG